MMHKTLLFSLFGFTAAVLAAPTSLDAATLLQNGEEAQALNRFFKSLKAADPCQGVIRPYPLFQALTEKLYTNRWPSCMPWQQDYCKV